MVTLSVCGREWSPGRYQLAEIDVELLPATTFLDHLLAPHGHIAGPKLKEREEEDVTFGFEIAKQLSALNVGQTVVVKNGTVLAVEVAEGDEVEAGQVVCVVAQDAPDPGA